MFNRFTSHSKNALKSAFSLALARGHKDLTPQHVLYGLRQQRGSIAAQILNKVKIQPNDIKESIETKKSSSQTITQITLAPATKKLLEKSFLIASINRHRYIGTEHLLASILSVNDGEIGEFFQKRNVSIK